MILGTVSEFAPRRERVFDFLFTTKCSFLFFTCSPSEDLFTHSSILSMCTVESTHLRSAPQFKDLCETKGPVDCCPGWNVGGYVALLFNRSSCFGITVRCQTQVLLHMHGEKK